MSKPSGSKNNGEVLLCKVKYLNNLPDIPYDPKFIAYPFDPKRFYQYNSTSLEKNFKWDVTTEQDMGVKIDLIDPNNYKADHLLDQLDPIDNAILQDDFTNVADAKRAEQHKTTVAWLRRNEYITTETNRFQSKAYEPAESKLGYSIKRKLSELNFYKDKESQIKAIEKSFEAAGQPIEKHFSKPDVYPVAELPIYPDFDLWKHSCAQVIFDDDPLPKGFKTGEMSQAIIRGMVDDNDEQFVAYYLPTEECTQKMKEDEELQVDYRSDEEYHFKSIREYTWNVKTRGNSGFEENYYFTIKNDGVFYNNLDTRVRLSKRRYKPGQVFNTKTKLYVKYRPLNKQELRQQKMRMKELTNEQDEEEDADDEETEADEQEEDVQHGEISTPNVQDESNSNQDDDNEGDDD